MPLGRWHTAEPRTLTAVLDEQVTVRPDQAALIVGDETLSYGALEAASHAAANGLASLGLGHGDCVAIFANTCPEWLTTWIGAARLGALSVPVNTAYRGEFLANPLRDSRCKVALVEAALADRLAAVAEELPDLETVVILSGDGGTPELPWPVVEREVLVGSSGRARHRPARWDEPVAILYTSGTTGESKGAIITHQYLMTSAATMVASWQLVEGETLYAPLPLFHISAVASVAGPLLAGATGLLDPVFSVNACWDRVRRYDVAGILLAGVMVNMLWNLPEDPADHELPLRFMSAAPIPRGLHKALEERYGLKVLTSYGMTEALPMTLYGMEDEAVEGACGRPHPGFEVVVLDHDDQPVAPGEVGQICCRPTSPHVMFDGYLGKPEVTVERWRNLWFHTGDLGRMDAEGNLTFVDRNKDVMRRRGENISSFELEQTLLRHSAVAEVAAVGVPSDLGEDDVKVVVALRPGAELPVADLMDFCVERLPYFAVPRYVEFLAELPKNASGKIVKTDLRAAGVTAATWDREQVGYVVRR